ncbi:MAG: hypothetical protein IKO61_05125 [Lachnospiraceae bacterium]|nr:hypothetical protein [Lachnospiraceae bacterium]
MKCPYCNNEMEIGMIQSAMELAWKKGLERNVKRAAASEGAVVLSGLSFSRGSAVMAFHCRGCQKVIIDYKSPQCDLNRMQ